MPLFEEKNQTKSNQTDKNSFETQTNQQSNQTNQPQEESGLIKTIGKFLPLAPFVYEQFTGQKVPQMSGTMAEIQLALTNLATNLQVITNNQQQIVQRINQLETKLSEIQTNAVNHLTNLTNQFNSFRLTHTKEKKEIAYNPPLEENQDY